MDKKIIAVFLLALGPYLAFAQQTIITGTVRDAATRERLAFVNVFFTGTQIGVTTDERGRYSIATDKSYKRLSFSFVGYKPYRTAIRPGEEQDIDVSLRPTTEQLKEVIVTSQKIRERYRNKDNPAVTLIRNVIKHRNENRIESYDYVEYEEYEKLQMSMSSKLHTKRDRLFAKRYSFFFDNRDTTTLYGFALLPIYMEETISDYYFRRNPKKSKRIIKASKKVDFDEFFDTGGFGEYLNQLYQTVDIYDANISLLGNRFLSPISDSAPLFYKFYLTDTLQVQGEEVYELLFVPRNNTDFLFQGVLHITPDKRYAVRHVDMRVSKNINLNWVRSLRVIQDFEKTPNARYRLNKSTIGIDFALTEARGGFYGSRTVSLKDFIIGQPRPDSLYAGLSEENRSRSAPQDSAFWQTHRHEQLTEQEARAYINSDSIQKVPFFRRTANVISLLSSGYQEFRFWELGPIGTFFSGSPVEGFRLKIGGHTLPSFNKYFYLSTYGAYGFRDKQWKYFVQGTYSFTGQLPTVFPVRALQASYQRDIKVPGQELEFVDDNNFLLSIRRGRNDKWVYNDVWRVDYRHEFKNHFSFKVGLKHLTQTPTGGISFTYSEPSTTRIDHIRTVETSLELRWAPHEKFFQGKQFRFPIRDKYPVFTARWVSGIKDLLGGQYTYQNFALAVNKRFYMSQIGFTDVFLEGGYIVGRVPFPLLKIHRANQTYSYQFKSYNLMNFLEFVSDRYVSIQAVHHFNGFFLNKIPLLSKLKLREILSFKAVYGGVRDENIPSSDNELFRFLTSPNGAARTYTLEQMPYMEISFGIENILKFLRIDFVRRLNYLDHPDIEAWGIRARIRFYF